MLVTCPFVPQGCLEHKLYRAIYTVGGIIVHYMTCLQSPVWESRAY